MHYACLDLNFYTLLYTMHVWPIESYIELTLFALFCDSLALLFFFIARQASLHAAFYSSLHFFFFFFCTPHIGSKLFTCAKDSVPLALTVG